MVPVPGAASRTWEPDFLSSPGCCCCAGQPAGAAAVGAAAAAVPGPPDSRGWAPPEECNKYHSSPSHFISFPSGLGKCGEGWIIIP